MSQSQELLELPQPQPQPLLPVSPKQLLLPLNRRTRRITQIQLLPEQQLLLVGQQLLLAVL